MTAIIGEHKYVTPEYLNNTVWATIKPSSLHGVGVFAIRDIKQGQRIHCDGGTGEWIRTDMDKLVPEVRKLIEQRWPIERDGEPFLCPNDDALLISFMNHSKKGANYNKFTDTAICDIPKDSEILEDYGEYVDIVDIK